MAYHEAGHCVTAFEFKMPICWVKIALDEGGETNAKLPDNMDQKRLYWLAGIAAEIAYLGEPVIGASDDDYYNKFRDSFPADAPKEEKACYENRAVDFAKQYKEQIKLLAYEVFEKRELAGDAVVQVLTAER